MKITAIRTLVVNAEMRNWVFVKVETDQDGLFGWGEATLEWKTRAVVGCVEDLAPLMVGRDPRDIENGVRAMTKHGFWKLGVIGRSAIAGIEHALIDMKAGGYRKVRISPHLAYRDKGIPDLIPPDAVLIVELWPRGIAEL